MRKSMVLLLATALAGCSLLGPGSPSDEQMAAADYGPRPSNDEIVLVAKRDALGHAVFKGIQAKDIQVVHSEPQTGWCGEKRRGFQFGWLVDVTATSGKAQMQKSYLLQQRPHGPGVLASPRGTPQNQPVEVTSKPASRGRGQVFCSGSVG